MGMEEGSAHQPGSRRPCLLGSRRFPADLRPAHVFVSYDTDRDSRRTMVDVAEGQEEVSLRALKAVQCEARRRGVKASRGGSDKR